MKAQNITIVGLGRTGTSLGLALQQSSLDGHIIGHDQSRNAIREAEQLGAIHKGQWRLVQAVDKADIVILAVPANTIEGILQAIGEDLQEHTLVLDLSGAKGQSQQLAERYLKKGHFVGLVPVLAAEALADGGRGVAAASADHFKNSVMVVAPAPRTDPKAVETAVNFGLLLKARPFFMDPAEYDSLIQGVETVPGLLAAAMFQAVTHSKGWRDILRFAGAPFAQSTAALGDAAETAYLALQDQNSTLRWLDALVQELQEVRRWVADGDPEQLAAVLEQQSEARAGWLRVRTENNWEEIPQPDFVPMGISEQFLGRRGGREE